MTTKAELDVRYGRVRNRGKVRAWWIVVGVVAVASIGWLGWGVLAGGSANVRADDTAFAIPDERTVSVSFQVTAPVGAETACAIEALDEDFGVVGWRVIVYPASTSHTQAYTETIPTVGQATTGLVNTCWVA